MADVTSRLGLKKPKGSDQISTLSVGPHDIRDSFDVLDDAAIYGESVAASRPAAGLKGRLWRSTDTGQVHLDTGSVWVEIARTDVASTPPGVMMAYGGATAPTGWLSCDGSQVSRTTYAALFGVIGTAYGSGNGSTTFHLPDFRGRTMVGAGSGPSLTSRSVGDKFGEEALPAHIHTTPNHSHTASSNTAGSHSHSMTSDGYHEHYLYFDGSGQTVWHDFIGSGGGLNTVTLRENAATSAVSNYWKAAGAGYHAHMIIDGGSHSHTITVNSGGASTTGSTGTGSHGVMQPSLVATMIIKT